MPGQKNFEESRHILGPSPRHGFWTLVAGGGPILLSVIGLLISLPGAGCYLVSAGLGVVAGFIVYLTFKS